MSVVLARYIPLWISFIGYCFPNNICFLGVFFPGFKRFKSVEYSPSIKLNNIFVFVRFIFYDKQTIKY